jgi:protein-L-isoaspartate(D-aspartate) O-methyltransferase
VSVIQADGTLGLKDKAPFDKIFVGGAFKQIPQDLKQQLKIGGILVGFSKTGIIMHAVKIQRISQEEYRETNLFETVVEYLERVETKEFKF